VCVVVQFAAQCTKELKTEQVLVRFDVHFLTGQITKIPDCLVKNRTPGNPRFTSSSNTASQRGYQMQANASMSAF